MRYCRYIDPVTRSAGDIFHAIRWLAMQKKSERQLHGPSLRGRLIGFSMRRWKQANLAPILGTLPQTVCFARGERELRKLRPVAEDCLACWGAEIPAEVGAVAEESGARPLRIEDGFIRSVGLGSDLIPPQSLVLDKKGIYFDPTKASGLEEILEHTEFTQADLDEARLVRQLIVDNGVTKYNMETRAFPEWENVEAQKVLVVGQVEDDASIRLGCTDIRTNLGLLQAVREQHPEAFVIYKPHPDVWTGNRVGTIAKEQALTLADHVETMTSITSCIDASNALHTLTSLSGFDALLRGLEVVTYGQPFYAGWGLTKDLAKDAPALSRRTRRLTLDQLVAGTLLHYPIYWDPVLRGYTTARAVIRQLVERRSSLEASGKLEKLGTGYVSRQLRKTSILAKALLR
jgi:capsular polysaccharide export protein